MKMSRSRYSPAVVVVSLLLIFAGIGQGCSDLAVDGPLETAGGPEAALKKKGVYDLMDGEDEWTEELVNEYLASPAKAKVDSLRQDILQRIGDAIDSGVEKEELAEALKDGLNGTSNADSTIGEYLFQSNAEEADVVAEIVYAHEALVTAFPLLIEDDLDDVVEPVFPDFNSAPTCVITDQKIDAFFADFDTIMASGIASGNETSYQEAPCGSWWQTAKVAVCPSGCVGVAAAGVAVSGGLATAAAVVAGGLCLWGCHCMLCPSETLC